MNETTGVSIAEKEKTRRTFVLAGALVLVAIAISWGVHGAIQARYEYESRKELSVSIGLFTGAVMKFTEAVGDLRDMTAGMEVETTTVEAIDGTAIYNNKNSTLNIGGDVIGKNSNHNDPLRSQETGKVNRKKQNTNSSGNSK